jgi:glutathione S-transferase
VPAPNKPIVMYDLAGNDPAHRFSPYCWRTRFALAHKNLPVDTKAWRFGDKANLPSEAGRVPVIIDGETVVADSWKIAEYLDERYPDRPALMGDAYARAHARFINAWVDTVLSPAVAPMVILDIWRGLTPTDQAYFRTSREQRLGKTLEEIQATRDGRIDAFRAAIEPLRTTLKTQKWIGGEKPSYADFAVAGPFQLLHCVSRFDPLAPDDIVAEWRGRLQALFNGLGASAVRS